MDHHWGRDTTPGGHHYHFHSLLETVSDRQAGVPAGRYDLYAAEAESKTLTLLWTRF